MADIFRGYIPSNGKIPLHSVKKFRLLEEPPSDQDYVGVLKDGLIQLDFDDADTAQVALNVVTDLKLKCDVLKTKRGLHLYFLNDDFTKSQKVGVYNSMGLKCDIGLGSKDRVIPLRITRKESVTRIVNGKETEVEVSTTKDREWLQTYPELDIIPPFFRPYKNVDPDFKNCDMRNQTLFDYILKLQFMGYSKNEVRKVIKVINQYMFTEQLSDREIDTITRDEAFSEDLFYDQKDRFLHHRFGDYMLANSNILTINNDVHIYTNQHVYSHDQSEFEKQMLMKIPSLKVNQRTEVYKYLMLKAHRSGEFSPPKYVGLKDMILDIETMEEEPYSPQFIINNKIEYSYNPTAYSEIMDKTLDKVACGDRQIRLLLEEMIGYSLYRANNMQVCFILTGEGSNGKSTLLNVIKKLLGKPNYTSLDLRELESTFKPAELYGKLANIGDDISSKYLESSSVFKKVVTGESFMVERKYQQPFELESYATQIFCANELPTVSDKSDGFNRRIVIIPFNAKFSKADDDYDPFIEDKLMSQESLEYLLKISLDGLKRVLYNRMFTTSDAGEAEKKAYRLQNNNVLEWLDTEPDIEYHSVGDIYQQYSVWCTRNGGNPMKKANMGRIIGRECGLVAKTRRIDGKPTKVYLKNEED